jgi:RNA polymerase sigma-70 factor (ECF subfamily)
MDKLPEKARLVFILKRHEGLSLNEIADQLGISPKTVENQITRALKILKDELEPYLKNMNSV